jgi:hypothetical protein
MPKSFRDLPQFVVTSISNGESSPNGYTPYELTGTFDSLGSVRLGRCWLLLPTLYGLIGDLEELNHESRRGLFHTSEKSQPCDVGASLAYVNGYWDASLIKMVVQPEWDWQKIVYATSDAVACRYENAESADTPKKQGTVWRKISPEELRMGHPILREPWEGQHLVGEPWVVPGGWDHEHCKICMKHIDPGDTAYVDPEDRWWFCRLCGEKYVLPHDLSFVDDS